MFSCSSGYKDSIVFLVHFFFFIFIISSLTKICTDYTLQVFFFLLLFVHSFKKKPSILLSSPSPTPSPDHPPPHLTQPKEKKYRVHPRMYVCTNTNQVFKRRKIMGEKNCLHGSYTKKQRCQKDTTVGTPEIQNTKYATTTHCVHNMGSSGAPTVIFFFDCLFQYRNQCTESVVQSPLFALFKKNRRRRGYMLRPLCLLCVTVARA